MSRLWFAQLLGLLSLAFLWGPRGNALAAPVEPVAVETCAECHAGEVASLGGGVHATANCVACHSGLPEHAADPVPETLPGKPAAEACQACHQKGAKHMNWRFSPHAAAGVACRDCHGIHQAKAAAPVAGATQIKDPASTLCANCHQDVLPRFRMTSHHPVQEGGVSCTNCHDPHANTTTTLSGRTELCTGCHQAVRGPHTFEHVPAAEGCTACHNPHGSPNRKLLQVAQPMLCMQCHSIADNRHGQSGAAGGRIGGAVLRSCTGCHSAVHGSSFDQHLRF